MYNLELDKAIAKIRQSKAKKVCIQLPDGLKPKAKEIQDAIEKATAAQVFIWAGSCFGSCDIPLEVKNLGVDLLIHWGHTEWK
jgi:2-(3-amino-3-carboxypropyl)histidine synthase